MAFLLKAPPSFPWKSSPFDKSSWNPSFKELLFTSRKTSCRPCRKNTIFGAPCGLCGQGILVSETLNHHCTISCLMSLLLLGPIISLLRKLLAAAVMDQLFPWPSLCFSKTPNDTLRLHDDAATVSKKLFRRAVDMAHWLPLHPLLAQPPPTVLTFNRIRLWRGNNENNCSSGGSEDLDLTLSKEVHVIF
ncbi:hypothetical protein SDJN03_22745, partial [Cucurbita argyrosperma subsp. sororia]